MIKFKIGRSNKKNEKKSNIDNNEEDIKKKGFDDNILNDQVVTDLNSEELNEKNYINEILDESSEDDDNIINSSYEEKKKIENKEENYYYINDAIKRNYPLEYEDNKIYPKVYCYEPTNFENFKKKIKNKNELRHYECYSSTMNEFFYKYNENYYDDILKNESFKKFAEELWSNRSNIKTDQQYQDLCVQLRKKYKISPSKHQISVALQHHYLQSLDDDKKDMENIIQLQKNSDHVGDIKDIDHIISTGNTNDVDNTNDGDNTNDVANTNDGDNTNNMNNTNNHDSSHVDETNNLSEEDEFIINKKGKDVKYVLENVNKMIITKEMKNYKDLDKESVHFLQINKRKGVRSNSGVLVVTIITHPHKFSCKYDCHYCPNEPNQPRSYLSTEPAILRANQNNFDVICQFFNRTTTLVNNGHVADKIEVLVLGGTWSCYDIAYQEEFIRDVYYAANIYPVLKDRRKKLTLKEEQEINEKSNCRIIGLTLETRPDQINKDELLRLRYYGCTRVQLGIQHIDDVILKKVNRQCTLKDCIRAIYLLKENGFKVDIHLMPDLPYSDVYKDIHMFKYVLSSIDLQADQWKIYPCEITPFTKIEKWYNNNEYKPYFETNKNLLISVILLVKKSIHPWIRLNRVIRDIPNPSIIAGNNITNMRQLIAHEMNIRNIFCQCIRCKEVKNQEIEKKSDSIFLRIYKYPTLGGDEYFITFQGKKKVVNHHGKKNKKNKKSKTSKKDSINQNCYEQMKEKDNNKKIKNKNNDNNDNNNNNNNNNNNDNINNNDNYYYSDSNGHLSSTSNLLENMETFFNEHETNNNEIKHIHHTQHEKSGTSQNNKNSEHSGASQNNKNSEQSGANPENVHNSNISENKLDTEIPVDNNIYEDYDNEYSLLGFLRLRLRKKNNYCDDRPFKCLENSALIRELHVYGSLLKHDDFKDELNFIQHKGLGKCLVLVAEIISYFYNYRKVSIIAGVGTREYYKKLGYTKEETYVTKILKREEIYKNYLLNIDRIGKTILIHEYNLKHCLYLMHKEIPEPEKYKRTEITNLNTYINENILHASDMKNYLVHKKKCTTSSINVQRLLETETNQIVNILWNQFNKWSLDFFIKNRLIFNVSTIVFFSSTFLFTIQFFKKRNIHT
ncbi:putative histone S-adenosyl methyltransferase [Plasmodium gaboni]|uniref:Putative histone S-adenosyl methyltransferase n=1 Tax=Plasmodium gaboni TaxID=647221 RepID=A0A151LGU2_9APIC|nr:putative histone S-adenosyl methyltransferase [Plasmodium gaboni]KYN98079.1 putative histone S-adenosyl methyltransferase [Plasmodium gaboni]